MQGFNHRNEYIATQGPLPDTVGDFWRLVWDHDCATIVMLTNLVEKMKVECVKHTLWLFSTVLISDTALSKYPYYSVILKKATDHPHR